MKESSSISDSTKVDALLDYNHDLLLDLLNQKAQNRIMLARVKSWESGRKAYADGLLLPDNPYIDKKSFEFAFWESAWLYSQRIQELTLLCESACLLFN